MSRILTADLTCLPLLASALTAAERGWPVIPLIPRAKRSARQAERDCPGTGRCAYGHRTHEQRATTNPDVWRSNSNGKEWKPALAVAGLITEVDGDGRYESAREHGMHALRHFYASALLDAGESIKAVSEYMGHAIPG
ncbi:hypothetical protein GCM10010304_59530 [Streptomyces roseoviolaceus]